MSDWRFANAAALLASFSTLGLVVEPVAASAQSAPYGYDQNAASPPADQWAPGAPPESQYAQAAPQDQGPPAGQYAPPPQGPYGSPPQGQYAPGPGDQYAAPPPAAGGQDYNAWLYQQNYQIYQQRYAQWAAQNCINQHNNSTAAGAIFGGVAGAILGASLAGWAVRGAWAVFGGALGATAGAAIGSSVSAGNCPNGYVVRAGAPPPYLGGPAYAYGGAAYGPGPAPYAAPGYAPGPGYGPAPYRGWVWAGGRWVRRPYRYGYARPAPYPYYRY